MKFTGFEVLDASIQRSNAWLNELMQELNWTDRRQTYGAFRCVLHALRDHLSLKDAVYVGEQLPMLIRGGIGPLVQIVLQALRRHVTEGEWRDFTASLPRKPTSILPP